MGQQRIEVARAWSELPEHLQEAVLARLPVECLFHFRGVCKAWKHLFRCTKFIRQWTEITQRKGWLVVCMPKAQMQCLAYCFLTHTWRTLSLSFIPDKCGVHYRGSAAGLLLLDVPSHSFFGMNSFPSMYVCNPLTRKCFNLPGMLCIRMPMARGIVGGADGHSYKIVAVGECSTNSIAVEVYDSVEKSWRIAGTLPHGLVITNDDMVFCGGSFFCVTAQPARIMAYAIEEGSWMVLPLPSADPGSVWPRLVACGSSVVIVGAIEEGDALKEVLVWELQQENDKSWREIGRMPPSVCQDFKRNSWLKWFESVGVGDRVCFRAHGSLEVVTFDIARRSWSWLPKCPAAHAGRKDLHLRSLAFQPRPDILVL